MSTSRSLWVVAALLVVPVVAFGEDTGAAKREFQRGSTLYRTGQYREAIAAFEAAYKARPNGVVLYNIAQCHEKLGELKDALLYYRRYLEETPKADDRAQVEATIASLEQRVAAKSIQELKVRSSPSGGEVSIDGAPRGKAPLSLKLPVGAHEVQVGLEGYETGHRKVDLTPSAAVELDIALLPKAALSPNRPAAPQKVWTWAALGTAGAALAAGVTFGLLAQQDSKELTTVMHQQSDAERLYQSAKTRSLTANVLYGVSGAAVVAGGALFFVEGGF